MGPKPHLIVELSEKRTPNHAAVIEKLKTEIDRGTITTKDAARKFAFGLVGALGEPTF